MSEADTLLSAPAVGDAVEGGDTMMAQPVQAPSAQGGRYDRLLLVGVLCLLGLGLVMVYSASAVTSFTRFGDGTRLLTRQLFYLVPAFTMMLFGALLPYRHLKRAAPWLLGIGVFMLILVLIPGVGVSVKGARRWINLYVARFQPSEWVKVAFVIYLAAWLSTSMHRLQSFKQGWLPHLGLLVVIAGLLSRQPDIGSGVICAGMLMLMLIVGGARWRHIALMVGPAVGIAALAFFRFEHLRTRLMVFLNPEADPLGKAFQINQALISFGSGGLEGVGLGGSKQKMAFLPDAHTDFIFSILGEELGWFGAAAAISLFAFVVWRGWTVARRAQDDFGRLLAFGLIAMIGFQAATNMAVVMALVPTKGLTLPFVSYGGSSLMMTCWMAGILLNVSRGQRAPAPSAPRYADEDGDTVLGAPAALGGR